MREGGGDMFNDSNEVLNFKQRTALRCPSLRNIIRDGCVISSWSSSYEPIFTGCECKVNVCMSISVSVSVNVSMNTRSSQTWTHCGPWVGDVAAWRRVIFMQSLFAGWFTHFVPSATTMIRLIFLPLPSTTLSTVPLPSRVCKLHSFASRIWAPLLIFTTFRRPILPREPLAHFHPLFINAR